MVVVWEGGVVRALCKMLRKTALRRPGFMRGFQLNLEDCRIVSADMGAIGLTVCLLRLALKTKFCLQ